LQRRVQDRAIDRRGSRSPASPRSQENLDKAEEQHHQRPGDLRGLGHAAQRVLRRRLLARLIPGEKALVHPGGLAELDLGHSRQRAQKDHHQPQYVRVTALRCAHFPSVPNIGYVSLVLFFAEGRPRGHGDRGGALSREPPCSPPRSAARPSSSCSSRCSPRHGLRPPVHGPRTPARPTPASCPRWRSWTTSGAFSGAPGASRTAISTRTASARPARLSRRPRRKRAVTSTRTASALPARFSLLHRRKRAVTSTRTDSACVNLHPGSLFR